VSAKARFSITELEKILCVPENAYIDRIAVQEDPHALIVYLTEAYETVFNGDSERQLARTDVMVNPDGYTEVEWELS
jgi:hypothetical protein